MKFLCIFMAAMTLFIGQSFADIHDPVQRIDRTSVAGYYTDADREEGTIIYTRDSRTRNRVSIVLTRDTGEIIRRNVNGRTFTFRELVKKRIILDFSRAERLSEGETQEVIIKLQHNDRFKVTDTTLQDYREPHEIKIKTWFLDQDEIAKIVIKKQ